MLFFIAKTICLDSSCWLIVLGFNTTLTARVISWWLVMHVFPGFLTPVLTQISFQSHRLLFSYVSEELRGENTRERNFASTGSRTHNYQVMSPTRSPLSHRGVWIQDQKAPSMESYLLTAND